MMPALPYGVSEETRHRTMMRYGSSLLLNALRPPPPEPPRKLRPSIIITQADPKKRWREPYVRMADRTPLPTPEAIREIINSVAQAFNIPPEWLTSNSRRRIGVLARAVAIRLVRERTWETGEPRHSTTKIGFFFNRDHATICHALESFDSYCKQYPEIVPIYEALKE